MSDPAPDPLPDPQRLALAWRIAPVSIDFILDVRKISRRDRDLIDSLLFATIISSNVAPLTHDATLQLTYAGMSSPAPPEVRRPVSINAVAQSMRIPFETARRRVRRMAKEGILEVSERGVVAPQSILQQADFIEGIFQRHERIGGFYRELIGLGAVAPPGATSAADADPPVLVTNRLVWEYVLRMADEMIALTGDPLTSLILLKIVQLNMEGFGPAERAAWAQAPGQLGRPARTAIFATDLRLSPETARRYVLHLESLGFVHRAPRGAVAVLPDRHRATVQRMALDNLANVQRMFARLAQLGVLGAWDAPAANSASA